MRLLKHSSASQITLGGVTTSTNLNNNWNYVTVGVRTLSTAGSK